MEVKEMVKDVKQIALPIDNIFAATRAQNRTSQAQNDGRSFESVMSDNARSHNEVARSSQTTDRAQNRQQNNQAQAQSANQNAQESQAVTQQADDNTVTTESSDTNEASLTNMAVAESGGNSAELELALEVLTAEIELVEDLAAVLGINPIVLAQILQEMDISPLELANPENQTALLQVVHNLETPVELLNLQEALPQMQEMAETLEQYSSIMLKFEMHMEHITQETTFEMPTIMEHFEKAVVQVSSSSDYSLMQDKPEEPVVQHANVQEVHVQQAEVNVEPLALFAQAAEMPIDVPEILKAHVETPQGSVSPQNIMEQIVNNMRFETRGELSELRIKLTPDSLGEINVRVSTINGIVTAQFMAESQRIKEIIEASFNQLRNAMQEQGINIAEIEVSVGDNGDNQSEFNYEGNISSQRIRDLMNGATDEMLEEEPTSELNDTTVNYRA
jgi:flagellar hook-length control protein FliK